MLFETKTIGVIYTVSKLLGHSRVATTEMYLHCSHKQLEQAMLADPLGAVYSVSMADFTRDEVEEIVHRLENANLSGANLDGANLDGVIGADFSGALNVPERYLKD